MPFGWTVNPFRGSGAATAMPGPLTNTLGPPGPRRETSPLSADLARARDSGQEVAIGTATDPYQPAEARFRVTRAVLEAMRGVPGLRIGITTKSASIPRDLGRLVEPRAPRPDLRLRAMWILADPDVRAVHLGEAGHG